MGLDLVEFVMDVEETFDISIPDRDATAFTTPGDLVEYLLRRLPPGGGWSMQKVKDVIGLIMKRQFAIDDFGWDQRFVQDLGLG